MADSTIALLFLDVPTKRLYLPRSWSLRDHPGSLGQDLLAWALAGVFDVYPHSFMPQFWPSFLSTVGNAFPFAFSTSEYLLRTSLYLFMYLFIKSEQSLDYFFFFPLGQILSTHFNQNGSTFPQGKD